MKRLFTLVIAIFAIATWTQADNRTQINLVKAISNDLLSAPEIGATITKPTITVTEGSPAYFLINSSNSWWQKKVDGQWQSVREGSFSEGTWRFQAQVRIDSSTDPNNNYILSKSVTVTVNGEEWTTAYYTKSDTYSFITVYSPEITAKEPDNRRQIHIVEATNSYMASAFKWGSERYDDTKFTVTTGAPAYFSSTGTGAWFKKDNGVWKQYMHDGKFSGGTWRYQCQVRIDSSTDPSNQYVVAKDIKVKVNGEEWEVLKVCVENTFSYAVVCSSEITIEDPRTRIYLVEATSEGWEDVPDVGVSRNKQLSFNITNGAPVDPSLGVWQQYLLDEGWMIPSTSLNDQFVVGTWRYMCMVNIKEESYNDYCFAENVRFIINGEEWEVEFNSNDAVFIYSPSIVVNDLTKIRQVEATTSPDWTTIVKQGETVETKPAFYITAGAPAFIHPFNWQKKVGGDWEDVSSGTFTPGTWRFHARVIREVGDYYNQYQLAHKVKVVVDGQEWETDYSTLYNNYNFAEVYSPAITIEEPHGPLGDKGFWWFADGVLTVDYNGAMPQNCSRTTTDPEIAYRLKWIDFLSEIKEVVVTGVDVEIQPYFLYYESDETSDGHHPDDHIKKVTLSSGVKSIGKQAFAIYDLKQFCCYGLEAPVLASDNNSNVHCFWKTRVEANKAFLVIQQHAGANYARTNSEWMIFANVGGGFLYNLKPEDDPVGIKAIDEEQLTKGNDGAWYSLDGRKLSGKPTQRGIYVNGGKKVVIK